MRLEKGVISIDLFDALRQCDAAQLTALVEELAVQDDVIDAVADQIFNGWTAAGNHGYQSINADVEPRNGLDRARRMVAARSGEVAEREIDRLVRALASEKETATKLRNELQTIKDASHRWRA